MTHLAPPLIFLAYILKRFTLIHYVLQPKTISKNGLTRSKEREAIGLPFQYKFSINY